jgi:hypothetical protein
LLHITECLSLKGLFPGLPHFFFDGKILAASACISDNYRVREYPQYPGIKRIAIFVKCWPAYLQLPNQNNPGADFIEKSTRYYGSAAACLLN